MGIFDDFTGSNFEAKDLLGQFFTIDLQDDGFTLSNADESVFEEVEWNEVNDVFYDDDHQTVNVELTGGKILVIKPSYSNYPQFLKSVPEKFPNFNREYVSEFYAELEGCFVCGMVAVHDELCENCGCGHYDPEIDGEEFATPEAYYKQMQLEYFELTVDPGTSKFFQRFSEWKPLITEDELDEYNESLE